MDSPLSSLRSCLHPLLLVLRNTECVIIIVQHIESIMYFVSDYFDKFVNFIDSLSPDNTFMHLCSSDYPPFLESLGWVLEGTLNGDSIVLLGDYNTYEGNDS